MPTSDSIEIHFTMLEAKQLFGLFQLRHSAIVPIDIHCMTPDATNFTI